MSNNHFRRLIVCLVLSVFEDGSDAFISKRREFPQVTSSPSTESVNILRSHNIPYPSSAEQATRPEQSTPDAAHTSNDDDNHRNGKIPAYLYSDSQPRTHQADMAHWPPREQAASRSITNVHTSLVNGSPKNVQGLYSVTGTRQMKAVSEHWPRRYSFGPSDVAPSVPSPTPSPSPGRHQGPGGALPDRFEMPSWDGHTRGTGPGHGHSFLTSLQRDKMAAAYYPGRSTNVNPLYGFQGSDHQPHKSSLVSTVDDVQLTRGAIDESLQRKSRPKNHNFVNTIYKYPSILKKYSFGMNRATNPTPVRSHSQKCEGLNEHSRNNDAMIHKSNEYDVKPLAHLAAMPFQHSSAPKENPSIDQSVNTKHPFLESWVQPVSDATLALQRLGVTVHPHVLTGDDTTKSVHNKFPHPASLFKTAPVATHENANHPRLFENPKTEFSSWGFATPSPVSSASRQSEDTVTYPTDTTSIPYRENVSDGLGKTQTRINSDKPGSLPIWQPVNHTQLSIMPKSSTASPVLDQSTTDPRSNDDIFSQREAALGIYRLRGNKRNKTVGSGPKITPKNINSTQNSLELPASESRTDPNAQPVATATDLGTRIATPTNAPWGPQPGPEALVANFETRPPENPYPVQEEPVPQTAATKTLYDILYKKPTSSVVVGKLVRGKSPMTQHHNGSFTFIRTLFPPVGGLKTHISSNPIQFADVAGSASFSGITPEKRPRFVDPLTPRIRSTTDAKTTIYREVRAQIPAPVRRDLSSRGSFFSVRRGGPRSASRVPRQEGRVDAGGDGSVPGPG